VIWTCQLLRFSKSWVAEAWVLCASLKTLGSDSLSAEPEPECTVLALSLILFAKQTCPV